jgi:cell division control protein 6
MVDTNEPPDGTADQGNDVETEQTSFDGSMSTENSTGEGESTGEANAEGSEGAQSDRTGADGSADERQAGSKQPGEQQSAVDSEGPPPGRVSSGSFGVGDFDRTVESEETSHTDDSSSHVEDMLLDEEEKEEGEASPGLFDDLLSGKPIFENKEVLRPSYTPQKLPHREEQTNNMATILVSALRGETPSNILIYGKTGTGKTASAKFVSDELESTSQKYEVPCEVEYINCEVTDTQYRVLAQLANKFIDNNRGAINNKLDELTSLRERARSETSILTDTGFDTVGTLDEQIETLEDERDAFDEVPMTGWPTDRVYTSFFDAVDYRERVVVIMLDEIDKLVEKSGDDTLYNLSRMNSELQRSRVSIIGISNDLKFTDFLDPRVKSSLGEEEIVFPPYDANQLRDILEHRAEVAFKTGALTDDVIPLCAAFAAQEHGDARRALDLLRTAGELAERDDTDSVEEDHVRQAQEKIELDRVVEVVRTLPQQSKLVLFAIILLEKQGVHNINTGEVYNIYKRLCEEIDADVLTQRRVTDLISELDMLGIVNAIVVSKGRYGRTKEISLSVPVDETETVLLSDSRLADIEDAEPFVQSRFDS